MLTIILGCMLPAFWGTFFWKKKQNKKSNENQETTFSTKYIQNLS